MTCKESSFCIFRHVKKVPLMCIGLYSMCNIYDLNYLIVLLSWGAIFTSYFFYTHIDGYEQQIFWDKVIFVYILGFESLVR